MVSIHDNEIVRYDVNIEEKTILLETIRSNDRKPMELTNIIFNSVEAHYFVDTNFCQNVLSDITEQALESAWEYNKILFEQAWRYGWLLFLNNNPLESPDKAKEDFITYLSTHDYHFFQINSSFGLNGWVISKTMEIYVNNL